MCTTSGPSPLLGLPGAAAGGAGGGDARGRPGGGASPDGPAISLQTFHIGPKIRDWDAVRALPGRLVEVHPEVSLRALAPDVAFAPKKTARASGSASP